jgi:hypothetical protein
MGGACWISPRNCASVSSTFSRVTCRQGAVRTRAPSLSYVSVSHPSKHVVRYSYQSINFGVSKHPYVHSQHAPLRNPRNCSTSWCPCQHRPLRGAADAQRTTPRISNNNQIARTENTLCERIQRTSLSNLHIVSSRPLFTRRLLEFLLVDEETRVTYESLQLVHDMHGRWSGWLYYAEEAR